MLFVKQLHTHYIFFRNEVMHQSIPNAPYTPRGNCGAFARLVSPGGGVFANLARPGGWAFANPGDNPEKFVDVFKGMFS